MLLDISLRNSVRTANCCQSLQLRQNWFVVIVCHKVDRKVFHASWFTQNEECPASTAYGKTRTRHRRASCSKRRQLVGASEIWRDATSREHQDGTHTSSCNRVSNASKGLVARNGLDAPAANIVTTAQSFAGPKLPNIAVLRGVKALNETVSEERTFLNLKAKRLLCNLFNRHTHARRIPCTAKSSTQMPSNASEPPGRLSALNCHLRRGPRQLRWLHETG
jgi:hypothetical protein